MSDRIPGRLLFLLLAIFSGACAHTPGVHETSSETTLILVSIDGFGADYLGRHEAPVLARLAASGARAEALLPVFPTKTFPNHYTIVTGLYPAQHGIIANEMWDPDFEASFTLGNRKAVEDGRWWGGEPIWVSAERQGVRSATFFWPGSEAEIAGYRPSRWKRFDGNVPGEERVDQVLAWLDVPAAERPRLLTLYFSDVDSAAHTFGPEAAETGAAVLRVDGYLGRLVAGLEARDLLGRVDLLLVSDHGMAAMSPERVIFLDDYIDPGRLRIISRSCILMAEPMPGQGEVVGTLRSAHPHLRVFTREELQQRFRLGDNRRIPALVATADEGWWIATSREAFAARSRRFPLGMHGFDPQAPSMHGLLVGHGPSFAEGVTTAPIDNIHLYELMAHILDIDPAENEGSLDAVRALLR